MNGKTFGNGTITAAGVAILVIVRLLINTLDLDWELRIYPILIVLIAAAYLGIREQRFNSSEELTYIMEWKAALRPTAVIAVIYSLFTFLFYKFIDPSFFAQLITRRKAEIQATIDKNDTPAEDAQMILENFDQMSSMIFTPLNWATFTMMGTIIFSLIFSALLVLLARQFPKVIIR